MSAKPNDDRRVQQLHTILHETYARVEHFGLTEASFLADDGIAGRSYADVLLMCVFRATEEAGKMSEEVKRAHPEIPWRNISGMRNIVAHDYGKVDRTMLWSSVTEDFPLLERFCRSYAEKRSIELEEDVSNERSGVQ